LELGDSGPLFSGLPRLPLRLGVKIR